MVTPATTCALVRMCWGEMTKPEPSIRRWQVGAIPMTLTMLFREWTRPGEARTAELGGATVSAGSAPRAPNTWTYGPLASRLRKSENMVRAAEGITPSTACSTAERWTCVVTTANGALTTAEPISQAMSRTEMTLTAAPATESIRVAGRQCTRERTAAPIAEASSWPIMAATNTATIAIRACWADPWTRERASLGAKEAPTAAPPRNPAKLSIPTMKPWR